MKGRGRVAKGTKPAAAAPAPVVEAAPAEPVLPLPDLHALRARIATLATTFGTRIPDGSKVDIGGLAVRLDMGGEPFAFGPGPFTMERHGDIVRLTFASEKSATTTPLAIDAELPLANGDVTARLSGGPVSLALLGVKEGTKGLFDVGRGTVSGKGQLVLAAAGDALTFDGRIALHSLSVKQPRLSSEPLRGIDFAVSGRGLLDDAGRLRVDDAELDMGALHVRTHGTLEETRDHFGLALNFDVAPAACQSLLDSAPQGLLPTVRAARMTGTFGATSRVVFDTRSIDKLVLEYEIDDRCRASEAPRELSRDHFASAFTYRTYRQGRKAERSRDRPGHVVVGRHRQHQPVHAGGRAHDRGRLRSTITMASTTPRSATSLIANLKARTLRPRREHHHDAAREEPLLVAREDALAEARGAHSRGLSRADVPQRRA